MPANYLDSLDVGDPSKRVQPIFIGLNEVVEIHQRLMSNIENKISTAVLILQS